MLSSPLEGWLASILGLPLWTKPYVGFSPCLCPVEKAWAFVSWSVSTSCSGQVLVSLFPGTHLTTQAGPALGRAAAKSPIPTSLPDHLLSSAGGQHTLCHTRGATPSTEPPTCSGQPKPIQLHSPSVTLTLEATR